MRAQDRRCHSDNHNKTDMVMLYPFTLVVQKHPRRLAVHTAALFGDCDLAGHCGGKDSSSQSAVASYLFGSASMCASSMVTDTSSCRRCSWIILLMAPLAFSILQIETRSACRKHAGMRTG